MFTFTDTERAYFSDMRGLVRDEHGQEVLAGLTLEETEFYVAYNRRRVSGGRDLPTPNRARFLELGARYEAARLQNIAATRQ